MAACTGEKVGSGRLRTTTRWAVLAVLVVVPLALSGCNRDRSGPGKYLNGGEIKVVALRPNLVKRTARLYIPSTLPKHGKVPLVVVLHGGFGIDVGAAEQTGFDAQAVRGKFLVVYPQGLTRSWNAGICCGPAQRNHVDDVDFVVQLLDKLERDYPIDTHRVFATGISNGGMMSYRLACDASDRFAAIAPVAATLEVSDCAPGRPVSVLHIQGLNDQNVPFNGGVGEKALAQRASIHYPPVRAGLDRFAALDECSPDPTSQRQGKVTTETWSSCRAGTAVELVTISDGGHSWPGGERMSNKLDPPSTALDATPEIWAFFQAHPRT